LKEYVTFPVYYKDKELLVIIDKEDEDFVKQFHWCISSHGNNLYVHRNPWIPEAKKNDKIFLHRELMGAKKGDGLLIDHINGDTFDNRGCNLRIATKQINAMNTGKNRTYKGKGTSSRFKGVSFYKKSGKWAAYTYFNREKNHLGYFADEIEAAKAYDEAVLELHGDYVQLNLPLLERVA
jgi:HNH endonuclease